MRPRSTVHETAKAYGLDEAQIERQLRVEDCLFP